MFPSKSQMFIVLIYIIIYIYILVHFKLPCVDHNTISSRLLLSAKLKSEIHNNEVVGIYMPTYVYKRLVYLEFV